MCSASVCVGSAKDRSPEHNEDTISDRSAASTGVWRDSGNVTFPTSTFPTTTAVRKQKPSLATPGGMESRHKAENTHNNGGGSAENKSDEKVPVRDPASKRNTSVQGSGSSSGVTAAIRGLPLSSSSTTAEQLRSATSLAGTLVLLLISVVIAGALFVMVICFIHKWKENMGTG